MREDDPATVSETRASGGPGHVRVRFAGNAFLRNESAALDSFNGAVASRQLTGVIYSDINTTFHLHEEESPMRTLCAVVLAVALLVGIAGTALANCGADHAESTQPTPQRPPAQS